MHVQLHGKQVNIRTNTEDFGNGKRTLVFLHGAGGTGNYWLGQYRALKGQFNLVIPDLPGHGESEGPAPQSVSGYAEWLAGFVDSIDPDLKPENLVFVGHSLGGAIAMEYFLSGGPAGALVLTSTGARLRVAPSLLSVLAGESNEAWAEQAISFFYKRELTPAMRDLVKREIESTPRSVYLNDFRAADGWDAMERVKEITIPTLVVYGDLDAATPEKYATYLGEQIQGAQLKKMAGAGHMPMIEFSAEYSALLHDFVAGLPPLKAEPGAQDLRSGGAKFSNP